MIVAAAVRINQCVCSMQAPARHHDILRQINGLYEDALGEEVRERPGWTYEAETQGFITDKGEFLDRRAAYLWDLDSGDGEYLTSGGDVPCPCCNAAAYVDYCAHGPGGNSRQRRRWRRVEARKCRAWAIARSTFPCGVKGGADV